ncbi:DUF4253 domain-containing protein [Streptomyces sp. NPDC007851]|uniref:DUF4253 domain-containing protein n=1 Tax=Streptomyces sp. NPDC007851 TaxID=3155008 RepID=UPI0034116F95
MLVPAHRGSDALALIGWSAEAPLPLLCALLRSWEDRFGAQAVAVSGSELHVSVARPPAQTEHANLLALEHVLSTADNIVDDPPTYVFLWLSSCSGALGQGNRRRNAARHTSADELCRRERDSLRPCRSISVTTTVI